MILQADLPGDCSGPRAQAALSVSKVEGRLGVAGRTRRQRPAPLAEWLSKAAPSRTFPRRLLPREHLTRFRGLREAGELPETPLSEKRSWKPRLSLCKALKENRDKPARLVRLIPFFGFYQWRWRLACAAKACNYR